MNSRETILNELFINNYNKANKELNLSCRPASQRASNEKLKDDGLQYLISFLEKHRVKILRLDWNQITPIGATSIAKILKQFDIRALVLNDNRLGIKGAKIIAEAIRDNNTLTYLDLHGNYLHD